MPLKHGRYQKLTYSIFECSQCRTQRTFGLNVSGPKQREAINRSPLIRCQGTCGKDTVHEYTGPGARPEYEKQAIRARTQLCPADA